MTEIEEFAKEYRNSVIARIESGANSAPDAPTAGGFEREFTSQFLEELRDLGQIDDYEEAYLKKRGIKANAYTISDEGDHLTLVSTLPKIEESFEILPSITKTEMEKEFKRLEGFYSKAVGSNIDVDPSSVANQMVNEISSIRKTVQRITFIIITGGRTSRIKEIPSGSLGKVETRYQLWTIERLYNLKQSGISREIIEVDFKSTRGGGIACLEAPNANPEIRTFMAVIAGDVIADLYHEYRDRLLQKNVRCFLQLRGNVNKGMRETIHDEPEYFMPFNNGLTITVENMKMDFKDGLHIINSVTDLQIVNGGQTTASIWSAKYRDKVDVSKVGVQAKIAWISDLSSLDELVTQISKFSNTQNQVRNSDFSSNHPFHQKMEKLSRNTRAPSLGDSQVDTYWFYERARGQFNDTRAAQGKSRSARQKTWDLENPRRQMFAMTDLAKFELTFAQLPHLVSLGAQKCFVHFMNQLAKGKNGLPDLQYFKQAVAKTILFKAAERVVSKNKFGGYRAQIVTYTMAKIQHMHEGRINFDFIWDKQEIHEDLANAIDHVCGIANNHIQIDLPARYRNPSEWAKKEACWHAFRDKKIQIPINLGTPILIEGRAKRKNTVGPVVTPDSSKEVKWLRETESEMWIALASWAKETNNFEGWQRKFMFSIGRQLGSKEFSPSLKQANLGHSIYSKATGLGFKP